MLTVTIKGEKKCFPQGTSFEKIVEPYQAEYNDMIAVVSVNGKIRELFKRLGQRLYHRFFYAKDDIAIRPMCAQLPCCF